MSIQLFKAAFDVEACLAQVRECLLKGWTGMGFKTVEFEEAWKKYTGHKHAYYINSNTAGLYMALNTLKEKYEWGGWMMKLYLHLLPLFQRIMQL